MYNGGTYLQTYCLSGLLNFTRFFFKARTGRRFVVNSHHETICAALDDVFAGKVQKLIINIAPRYGKTELAVKNFIAMGLAINPAAKFLHLSYSDDLAHDNSEEIRDIVKSSAYNELFPYVEVKRNTDSKKKWSTTAGGGVYATATGGQVTGFGAGAVDEGNDGGELAGELDGMECGNFAGAVVIDDPIKPEDALSELRRNRVNSRFETTIRNRVNSRHTPIIIIMQRLHDDDLCGYLQRVEPGEWRVLSLPCIIEDADGTQRALWPFKHTLQELHALREVDAWTFGTQYMQHPIPAAGLMYERGFKTYSEIPVTKRAEVRAYVDTADTGSDNLCCIIYTDTEIGIFVQDVYYTAEPMEITESETARRLGKYGVQVADIESNNGGRGFARNVERICRELGNNKTAFNWFHQSKNKAERIFTHSAEVQNLVHMPGNWEYLFPKFHKDVTQFLKVGGNAHDDAPDALTGCVERHGTQRAKGVKVR